MISPPHFPEIVVQQSGTAFPSVFHACLHQQSLLSQVLGVYLSLLCTRVSWIVILRVCPFLLVLPPRRLSIKSRKGCPAAGSYILAVATNSRISVGAGSRRTWDSLRAAFPSRPRKLPLPPSSNTIPRSGPPQ
ncbi:hypothetical protein VTK26DRAFT_5561 [Humicola hyalothermophila]